MLRLICEYMRYVIFFFNMREKNEEIATDIYFSLQKLNWIKCTKEIKVNNYITSEYVVNDRFCLP